VPASIRNAVTQAAPQIIHTSTIEDFGAGFWRWAKQAGYVTVHTLRSNCLLHRSANMYDSRRDRPLTPDLLSRPKRRASQSVDGVVGISNDILQRHLHYRFFGNAKATIIGNPFEGDASDCRVQSDGAIRLGLLGRIEPDKGVSQLIDQLQACRTQQRWRLQIAGEGETDYVRHLKQRSEGLPIEFVGWAESRLFLRNLDLLVIPSRCHEAFGRGVVEANSVGVPVLCLRRGGLPELVVEGATGWVLDEWSDSALAKAIDGCRTLDHHRMVHQAQDFSVAKISQKYVDFYRSIV
jgi:glycosyltransferase involved in cell wall biosynthesis